MQSGVAFYRSRLATILCPLSKAGECGNGGVPCALRSKHCVELGFIVIFQKTVLLAAGLVAGKSLDAHGVNAVENILFDIGVDSLEALDQLLCFLALADADDVAASVVNGAGFLLCSA